MKINKNDLIVENGLVTYKINKQYDAVYGFGEKFDNLNQKGKIVKAMVKEKCFYQGEFTYLSMPFFITPNGFGIYVDTYVPVEFDLTKENEITITYPLNSFDEVDNIYLFNGSIKEIMGEFRKLVGSPKVFPKWALGSWMSSNRWRCESDIYEQLELNKINDFPHNVMVIERWSDLTTRYLFNETTVSHKEIDEFVKDSDVDYSKSTEWKNPKKMVEAIHDDNIKVILWLVPIYAQKDNLETDNNVDQALSDNKEALLKGYPLMKKNGKEYLIPHTWCIESMVPDFTNSEAKENYLKHFKWLLDDLKFDGFKTDGGEFIHELDVLFKDGTTGLEGQQKYAELYSEAFSSLVGNDKIIFSRAGSQKSPSLSIMWAGDQESTWSEFRSIVKAGLTASLSGCSTWGFDISGFSGYLPSLELYRRSLQFAAFSPIMQWHSDPITNGRIDFSGEWKNNDRSPWNIANYYKDQSLLLEFKKQFNLHYNLLPYQYSLMLNANKTGIPALRALVIEYPDDKNVYSIENEVMLGDSMLIAPILHDYIDSMDVYLPDDIWFDMYNNKKYSGGTINIKIEKEHTPTFIRNNSCIPMNLHNSKIENNMTNDLTKYDELTFVVSGNGTYYFYDDLGNEISIKWDTNSETILENKLNTKIYFKHIEKDNLL